MGYTVIAPMGDNPNALFVGMKEFATERVFLITPRQYTKKAHKLAKKLETFSIPTTILELKEGLMEGMFYQFAMICQHNDHDNLIVNVATGDRLSTCAALSAAFANGLKAFGIMDGKPMLLPIMKLSYYNELTPSKHKILAQLKADEYISLTDLATKTKMSISLLSYHINGTLKYKGLLKLRLVETKDNNKNVLVRLSQLGSLLLRGYIESDHDKNKTCYGC